MERTGWNNASRLCVFIWAESWGRRGITLLISSQCQKIETEKSVCSVNGSSQQAQPPHTVAGPFALAAHPCHSKISKACSISPTIQLRRQQKTIFSVFIYFVIMAWVISSAFVFATTSHCLGWSKSNIKAFFLLFVLGHITSLQRRLINSFVHERTDRASFPKGPS